MTHKNKSNETKATNFGYWNEMLKDAPKSYSKLFDFEKKYLQRIIKPNSNVLDVCCGDGRSLSYLVGEGRTLRGIDVDKEAISLGKEKYRNLILFNHENIFNYKPKEKYDYVLCLNAIGNFGQEKSRLIQKMEEFMDKNSEVILDIFNEDAFDERIKIYNAVGSPILRVEGTTCYFDYEGGEHPSEQFTRTQLLDLFSENGLENVELIKKGIGYFGRWKFTEDEKKFMQFKEYVDNWDYGSIERILENKKFKDYIVSKHRDYLEETLEYFKKDPLEMVGDIISESCREIEEEFKSRSKSKNKKS